MEAKFNAYDTIGIIAPGSIIVLVSVFIIPEFNTLITQEDFSVGDLGLFVILSFVAGHLLQFFGNCIEKIFWKFFGGMPTEWVLKDKKILISKSQKDILASSLISAKLGDIKAIKKEDWYPITRQIYAMVKKDGCTERIDLFNQNYGLLRGIASAFFIVSFWLLLNQQWIYTTIAFLVACTALCRMYRFAVNYARELFIQYLTCKQT